MNRIQFNEDSSAEIILFNDLQECATLTANLLKTGKVALSGGSTFASLFKSWATMKLNLNKSEFFPVDERVVPFEHKSSNWGFAYNNFLKHCSHEIDKQNYASSKDIYLEVLKKSFQTNSIPQFDVIMLGVGDDGHTASLFPNGDYLTDTSSIVLETKSPKAPFNRISLSPATILKCKKLITIISGSEKKEIFDRIKENDLTLPIVSILSKKKNSIIYLDKNLIN